ncbi:MAG TPA: crotonase/enoyl-CoA hydratase family protein [Candidatus Cybelea sp.]|nr:crotonase/enoyl-CoA hydratase family protein [Candidatus Cybelea sp.]
MSIKVERQGAVTTVIIDRPQVRNAVDRATGRAMLAAFRAFEADDAAKVAVLCGENGAFCAGADLKAISETPPGTDPDPYADGPIGPTRTLLAKPVIAAVAGHAVAGGLELALWCDLRVAEEDAVFGVYCRRWGVPLVDGGTIRLPRLIGMSRALDMILTGRPVGAREALDFGLVNRLVPKGRSRDEAEKLAAEIARFPQLCLRADRRSAYTQWDHDLPRALIEEARGGIEARRVEGVGGAARFASGKGRHGAFADI